MTYWSRLTQRLERFLEPAIYQDFSKIVFNDSVVEILRDGKCKELLGPALAMLPNLNFIQIKQPLVKAKSRDGRLDTMSANWTFTVNTLLLVI